MKQWLLESATNTPFSLHLVSQDHTNAAAERKPDSTGE